MENKTISIYGLIHSFDEILDDVYSQVTEDINDYVTHKDEDVDESFNQLKQNIKQHKIKMNNGIERIELGIIIDYYSGPYPDDIIKEVIKEFNDELSARLKNSSPTFKETLKGKEISIKIVEVEKVVKNQFYIKYPREDKGK